MDGLKLLSKFIREVLAIATISGIKTPSEKFAGAEETYTLEAILQDGKALQMATSHYFGQNFSRAYDVKFNSGNSSPEYVWGTTWGCSTRLIGAIILSHSDTKGLIIPPLVAPIQVIIVPIYKADHSHDKIKRHIEDLVEKLQNAGVRVSYDLDRRKRPGKKFYEYELKGVPVRVNIGHRELSEQTTQIVRRDSGEIIKVQNDNLIETIKRVLTTIQDALLARNEKHLSMATSRVDSYNELSQILNGKKGFVRAYWDGSEITEAFIKQNSQATIRCIPFDQNTNDGKCIVSGNTSKNEVLVAKSY